MMAANSPSGDGNLTLPSWDHPKQPSIAFVCADDEAKVDKKKKKKKNRGLPDEDMGPKLIDPKHSKIESESEINLNNISTDTFAQYNVYNRRESMEKKEDVKNIMKIVEEDCV